MTKKWELTVWNNLTKIKDVCKKVSVHYSSIYILICKVYKELNTWCKEFYHNVVERFFDINSINWESKKNLHTKFTQFAKLYKTGVALFLKSRFEIAVGPLLVIMYRGKRYASHYFSQRKKIIGTFYRNRVEGVRNVGSGPSIVFFYRYLLGP